MIFENRTPRQHRIIMNRMGKIFRLFKPDGMSNADWYWLLKEIKEI